MVRCMSLWPTAQLKHKATGNPSITPRGSHPSPFYELNELQSMTMFSFAYMAKCSHSTNIYGPSTLWNSGRKKECRQCQPNSKGLVLTRLKRRRNKRNSLQGPPLLPSKFPLSHIVYTLPSGKSCW